MLQFAPSILNADYGKLAQQVALIQQSGLNILHLDVMDGHFVPEISFGAGLIASLRKESNLIFDVHMMVQEPAAMIPEMAESGADIITVHAEACTHLHQVVREIKALGKKACVALNPATPLSVLDYLYEDLDMILLMTVNPGYGGQTYIPAMTDKIRSLRGILDAKGLKTDIEVDGGIKAENAAEIYLAGANIQVAGSCIFHGDVEANLRTFRGIQDAYRD